MVKENRFYKTLSLCLLGILAAVVYGYRIHYPLEPYFDETHYVTFVQDLIYEHKYNQYRSVHPPLWHVMMAYCTFFFGDFSWSWRLLSLLSGLGLLVLMYPLTKKITGDKNAAALAVFLMMFDCISLTQARIALPNAQMLLFSMLAVYHFLDIVKPSGEIDKKKFVLTGVFWGLALATKLVAFSFAIFFSVALLFKLRKTDVPKKEFLKHLAVYFYAVPLLIYLAAHAFIPFLEDRTLADIWEIQRFNFTYNLGGSAAGQTHPYSSVWWSWPIMKRPIWFYFQTKYYETPSGTVDGIISIGNPVIFWVLPIVLLYCLKKFFLDKSRAAGLILLGFCGQWLFFALGNRLMYFHYYYQAMPFVNMAIAFLAGRVWQTGKAGRTLVVCYLILVAGMFVFWYPLLTGMTVTGAYYGKHIWFRSWV